MAAEVVSGLSECRLLAGINVGMKLFALIFTSLAVPLGLGRFMSVQSCLSVALVIWCTLCGVVYWRRLPQLPVNRVGAFMETGDERDNVIAHRGGAADAPENTLEAFEVAKKNGAFAVEVDIGITKDGIAVLLHDWSVDRTTDGAGMLSNLTYGEVRQLNAAAKFTKGSPITTANIPTLDECVEKCKDLDLKIFFDVKDSSHQAVTILIELFERYPHLMDSSIVCSFRPDLIYKLRLRNPQILTALTMGSRHFQHQVDQWQIGLGSWAYSLAYIVDELMIWSMYNWLWYLCGNSAVLLSKDSISGSVIDYWKDRDIIVVAWTVNRQEEKRYFQDFHQLNIITDTLVHGSGE